MASRDVTLSQNTNNTPMIDHQFDYPEEDAERAMLSGERPLRGVNRFTTIVPGISADHLKLQTQNIRLFWPFVGRKIPSTTRADRVEGMRRCVYLPRMLRSTPLLGVVRC
jgi:hypothetical protein